MKSFIKIVVTMAFVFALLGAATLMVIKYFDVLAALADRIKEAFQEKKHAFFSAAGCCDEEDEEEAEAEA